MASSNNLKKFIVSFEGGYVNDPNDKGGETNKGITIGVWRSYCVDRGINCTEVIPEVVVGGKKYFNVNRSLYEISDSDWDNIFINNYFNMCLGFDIVNQSVCNIIVDWFYNSGSWGIKLPQRVLGVREDGIVGSDTLRAINNFKYSQEVLFNLIKDARVQYLSDIVNNRPTNIKFKNGWLRRVNSISYGSLALNNGFVIPA